LILCALCTQSLASDPTVRILEEASTKKNDTKTEHSNHEKAPTAPVQAPSENNASVPSPPPVPAPVPGTNEPTSKPTKQPTTEDATIADPCAAAGSSEADCRTAAPADADYTCTMQLTKMETMSCQKEKKVEKPHDNLVIDGEEDGSNAGAIFGLIFLIGIGGVAFKYKDTILQQMNSNGGGTPFGASGSGKAKYQQV